MILWLVSCTTSRQGSIPPRILPPDPINAAGESVIKLIYEGETVEAQEDGVFIPYWYFEKLYDYIIDTQAAQDIYINDKKAAKK